MIVYILFLGSTILSSAHSKRALSISEELSNFIGTLEQYMNTANEVIFLLDESGSISAEKYPEVKQFTELTARHLAVSADKSRVAVISFSDTPRIHVNYIKDSAGNNMCTLIRKIHAMDYLGLGTATRLAMEKSREVFAQARQNSTKIIILITDGQSNSGYSPIDEANRLKREGVVIFAVGVADINTLEIEAVASSKSHIYILENFDYLQRVNEYLVKAIKEVSWDYVQDTSLCDKFCDAGEDCCDSQAHCYCGTIGGAYECNCGPGYYGTGHKHGCHECPKGTYKAEVGNKNCTLCPKHATTQNKGSSRASDCLCENGYEWHRNYCKAIECARLVAPTGGILIPSKCDNIYGTECKVKCKEGYCPYSCNFRKEGFHIKPWDQLPLQSRTCLVSGKWSANDFKCEKMRCPELEDPLFGSHNCSGSEFSFGTTCSFYCDDGYDLSGSTVRSCLSNGSWSGTQTKCLVKYCDPLKINQNLRVKPKRCSAEKMPFASICVYYCGEGYSLTSHNGRSDGGIKKCLANETWSGRENQISCEDTSRPSIKCPNSISTKTDPSKSTASVQWDLPIAEDNIFVKSVHIKEPQFIRKPPYSFPIGSTKIVYEARDSVDLSNTCSFNVTVLDKEPPLVLSCPSDIEIFSENNDPVHVTWEEPKFQDNSGKYHLTPPNKKRGDVFTWASRDVIFYNVSDPSGNKAFCNFTVTVKPYPCPYLEEPENGMVICDKWQQGRLCSVFCKEGYEFASKAPVPTIFECLQSGSSRKKEGTWVPFSLLPESSGFQMPLPDCSKKQKRTVLDVSLKLNYTVDDCSDEAVHRMKEKFLSSLKPFDDMLPNFFCQIIDGVNTCRPENVRVQCMSNKSKQKRSIRLHRENTLVISLDFKLQLSGDRKKENFDNSTSLLAKEIEVIVSNNVREVYNLPFVPEPNMSYNVTVICLIGQLRINNTCVNCPAGTYKDDISGTCVDCPSATYQDKENSLSCLPCPKGYTTYQERSKHFFDCKAPCQPGAYSQTSFEPCFPCPFHTYQTRFRSQECLKCPLGLQTWKTSANSSTDCSIPCSRGSFSDTGLEPCSLCDFGFYQDKTQQKFCEMCPKNTTTREEGSKTVDECKNIDICEEIAQCAVGSTCVPEGNGYTCICPQGFFGKNCEDTSNYCESDYCLNNGTCFKKFHELECICVEGFSGVQCEINIDDCKEGLCGNGECKDLINGYECVCPAGYTGSNCQVNRNDCFENPCYNGGICFDRLNGYKCCCPEGYTGVNCEVQPLDPCASGPCFNDGICSSNETDFSCSCSPGYEGKYCESDVDECYNHTCFNGGVCQDGHGHATCLCPLLFDGNHCETAYLPVYSMSSRSPSTANYAMLPNGKRLSAVTVSFFMRTDFKKPQTRPTAFSYAYFNEEAERAIDNGLTLFDTNRIILYIHNEILHTGFAANKDFNWHHYAVLWERKYGNWSFFVDGNVIVEGSGIGKGEYMWPGIFVLGQEQDSVGGTFSTPEAFVGDISEFNVWDYVLSKNEIKQLGTKCGFVGNLIPWFQFSTNVYGNGIVSKDVDWCKNAGTCSGESCHCLYSTNKDLYQNNQTTAVDKIYILKEEKCKYQVKSCSLNPCQNSQSCVEEYGKFYCNCSFGFDGKFCDYDINECLDNNGGCSHSCVNTDGSYKCVCPENMILSQDGLNCKDSSFCQEDGQIFLDGQVWMRKCTECRCDKSNIICTQLQCNERECQNEENLVLLPGDCCPKCVSYSFCLVFPNNTVSTFESLQMEIQKECDYSMVEDCINANFKVSLEFSEKNMILEKNLILYQSCHNLRVSQKGNASLDGDAVFPPFKNEFYEVQSNNLGTEVWTKSGFYLQTYIDGEILLAVPSDLTDSTCGMCGNVQNSNVRWSPKYEHSVRS